MRPVTDLGKQNPHCTHHYHGTYTAYRRGCTCPHARQAYLTYRQAYDKRRRPPVEIRRNRQIDPLAVDMALDGYIPARSLTTDERRLVVAALAAKHESDRRIAEKLRWSGGGQRGKVAVAKFRNRWQIPPGVTPGFHYQGRAVVA